MNEKFTPGPWEVLNSADVFTAQNAKRRDGVASAYNDGWHIADCAMGVTFMPDGQTYVLELQEVIANAHLIAAAPDMYAVLSELEESSTYWSEYDVPIGIPDRIMAALKKARGEQ